MRKKISPSKVSGTITAPTSKSYAQRAVAAALLSEGTSRLTNMDLCNDTIAALDTARKLGAEISNEGTTYAIKGSFAEKVELHSEQNNKKDSAEATCAEQGGKSDFTQAESSEKGTTYNIKGDYAEATCAEQGGKSDFTQAESSEKGTTYNIKGDYAEATCAEQGGKSDFTKAESSEKGTTYNIKGGFSPRETILNIGESGLATRLFTPIAALHTEPITITGEGSILTRPIEAMRAPLEQLGVQVTTNNGFLPIIVKGALKGGKVTADGSLSSQFITGLLTALPLAKQDTTLIVNDLQSKPYVDMTIEVLRNFGIKIEHEDYKTFHIKGNQRYEATDYNIEGDWSGASCMLVAGAIAGEITIENLNPRSLQADRKIIEALMDANASVTLNWDSVTTRKSRLRGFVFDAMNCPDLFPALVALAANCDGESKIVGTERLIHKESNRAATLASEFGKLGIIVDISECNIMRVERGTPPVKPVEVDSHNDHRIAMATAVAALTLGVDVTINGTEAVSKSYPEFFSELARVIITK